MHLVLPVCLVIAVVAMLPGRRIYSDTNHCFGNGLASLASTEHHGDSCTPSYTTLERTEPAGGWPAVALAIAIAIGAAILYRKPRRSFAVVFWLWSTLPAVGLVAMTFDLDFFDRVVVLWPEHVLGFAGGMLGVLVIAAPILAFLTRDPPSDSLPVATGSTDSR